MGGTNHQEWVVYGIAIPTLVLLSPKQSKSRWKPTPSGSPLAIASPVEPGGPVAVMAAFSMACSGSTNALEMHLEIYDPQSMGGPVEKIRLLMKKTRDEQNTDDPNEFRLTWALAENGSLPKRICGFIPEVSSHSPSEKLFQSQELCGVYLD